MSGTNQKKRGTRKFKGTYTRHAYKNGVAAAYELGVLDGRRQRQETLHAMQAANTHLVEELLRLDTAEPNNCIAVPFPMIKAIEKSLITTKTVYCLKLLRERMDAAGMNVAERLEEPE